MTTGPPDRLSTGVTGLDEILHGGLIGKRSYLVRGRPGTGKTTLGLQFLTEGVERGEVSLFVNLGEDPATIRRSAETMGFDADEIEFLDMSPTPETFVEGKSYDIFSPAEVERDPMASRIAETIREVGPDRVFVDSISQFRYLTPDDYQFHKQVLSFLQFLKEEDATVLLTSQATETQPDDDLQFLTDGIINLESTEEGRVVSVTKFRGSDFQQDAHSLKITDDGLEVFPRLVPEAYEREFAAEMVSSGVAEIDELLHGGLERGSLTLLSGPSGVGKTTIGTLFMKEAAGRGERSVLYMFDEPKETLVRRSEGLNIPVEDMIERGTFSAVPIEALQVSAGEFAHMVKEEVEEGGADMVMIDAVDGLELAIRDEEILETLHALVRYLQNMGVTTIIVTETGSVGSKFQATQHGSSYLVDNIVFLRHLEIGGELRKAIGVLKKRTSDYERSLREIEMTSHGIKVGEPLRNLRGIMSGTPEFVEESPSDDA